MNFVQWIEKEWKAFKSKVHTDTAALYARVETLENRVMELEKAAVATVKEHV